MKAGWMARGSAELLPPGMVVLERGWLSANNVVLRGSAGAAVVDTGYWTHARQMLELVEHALGGQALTHVVNTHLHSDHCGGNAALQGRYEAAQTWIPPGLAEAVRCWDADLLTYGPTGQHCPRFAFHGLLPPGGSIKLGDRDWQVHTAPGHDPHSVILFEPESRTLISADALWENGFGIVFQELEGDRAFDEVEATLDLIERLAPRIVVPGHGSVFTDVAEALDRARSRLAAYVADPRRHAAHAAKVLLKFKLLELERVRRDDFERWAENTPYFALVHRRWFPQQPLQEWLFTLLEELVRSGAAQSDTCFIANR